MFIISFGSLSLNLSVILTYSEWDKGYQGCFETVESHLLPSSMCPLKLPKYDLKHISTYFEGVKRLNVMRDYEAGIKKFYFPIFFGLPSFYRYKHSRKQLSSNGKSDKAPEMS